ncbi:MAG: TetR/AcrR family transcriptional regulator [Sinimarinibacterium flocculans]|uniref:TetR family transcriptional regulator n=1 Tax=Sinimarinibacterium flocculans TaxID=985250 RepID=A0A318EEM4_9GAMM|nr:TetR/AcrR family transcriptional regulator [Sinimarinibacterium flocculans]PXV70482.1 TetR family transcriptional regulator [Sinimarinibacterium flocculans]
MPTSALRIPAEGAASPRVGRPPRVQAPDIIAAAIEIGLDKVTLKQVADRLGVGIATLYRHVRNRDELVRLAAFRVALTSRLPRRDAEPAGHWTTVAIGYAETLFESFAREPQLVYELMKGRLGPDVEIDFLEQFLAALEPHGFTPAQGVQLHHAVAMLAIGAAVGATSVVAAVDAGLPQDAAMRRALAERGRHELPRVRSARDVYVNTDPSQWLRALHDLLRGIALSRGEPPPDFPA